MNTVKELQERFKIACGFYQWLFLNSYSVNWIFFNNCTSPKNIFLNLNYSRIEPNENAVFTFKIDGNLFAMFLPWYNGLKQRNPDTRMKIHENSVLNILYKIAFMIAEIAWNCFPKEASYQMFKLFKSNIFEKLECHLKKNFIYKTFLKKGNRLQKANPLKSRK